MTRLRDKRAIITGAASGIGRASALLFAENGAKMILCDQNESGLNETLALVEQGGGVAVGVSGDVGSQDTVRGLLERCERELGGIDVFFANAGIAGMIPIVEESVQEWERLLRVNLIGAFLAVQMAAPRLAKQGKGSIILTASVAGLRSGAGSAAYSASKAGVISLAQSGAAQFGPEGVRVNAICPGLIETGMTKPLLDAARAHGRQKDIGRHCPLQRAGESKEIAALALFLASDESSYITGQALVADGGLSSAHAFRPGRVI